MRAGQDKRRSVWYTLMEEGPQAFKPTLSTDISLPLLDFGSFRHSAILFSHEMLYAPRISTAFASKFVIGLAGAFVLSEPSQAFQPWQEICDPLVRQLTRQQIIDIVRRAAPEGLKYQITRELITEAGCSGISWTQFRVRESHVMPISWEPLGKLKRN